MGKAIAMLQLPNCKHHQTYKTSSDYKDKISTEYDKKLLGKFDEIFELINRIGD